MLSNTRLITVRPRMVNRQAIERLFRGLERFVNTGDSNGEYKALAKAWPRFWPINFGGVGRTLDWSDECYPIFLVFRNTLRRLWLSGPFRAQSGPTGFLLGLVGDFGGSIVTGLVLDVPEIVNAWRDF